MVPAVVDIGSDSPVELGVSFKSDVSGYITGIRFYKSAANTGAHVGNLWSNTGTLLATATFTGESAAGWQQVNFSSPVAITANAVYVASYHVNGGHYSANWDYFASSGMDNAPLHAPASGSGTPNGRYVYGSSSAFPTRASFFSRNFWVDVLFTSNAAAVAPSITTQPASQTLTVGQTAFFSVAATGTAPLSYQWKKNGAIINGATSSSYTTPATTTSDNGVQFTAVVSNGAGSTTSNPATLTVNAVIPPLQIMTSQLSGGTLTVAYTATLGATGGSAPYSWSLSNGILPTGLSLASSGPISGTPTVAGTSSFTAQVKDAAGRLASANFSINIAVPAPTVVITAPAGGATVSGTSSVSGIASDSVSISSVQVSVDGGTFANASGTNNWSFPLNTSSLSNGPHTLTAKVTDVAGVSATSSPVTITVSNGSTATDCTVFASPSGNDSNSGSTASSPKSFFGAANATRPGSVLCLLGGTYNLFSSFTPPNSGSPSGWIVYKAYGDGPVNFVYTGPANAASIFRITNGGSFPSGGPAYLEFRSLDLNGRGNSGDAFWCGGTHHLRFISNTMHDTGGSGVASRDCDYLTADHNLVYHNGYMPSSTSVPQWYGWTSGISFNSDQWFDNYSGFHNIISNNIVVGEFDSSSNHTDGNGIILDLSSGSYDPATANTPPALIVNNVVYGNGGRCILGYVVTNFWFVNNTCFKNGLDTLENNFGSFTAADSHDGYLINNIAVAISGNHPSYGQSGPVSNLHYFQNLSFGSSPNFSLSDPTQFTQADPLFLSAPSLSLGGYSSALVPSLLGNGLTLLPLSPAYNRGIDPSTITGVPSAIVTDLKKYIYTDINGNPRPQGGGSDLGAYQH
jgi:hypothetical protein